MTSLREQKLTGISWDECYKRELNNYSENTEDEGTVWFADSGAEEKVIEYLARLAQDGSLVQGDATKNEADNAATSFLDLGTGNGHLLFALREEGFAGHMLGVDYSAASVQLATQIEQTRRHGKQQEDCDHITGSLAPIDFKELDILSSNSTISHQFDVMLDKGTFDAISLSSELDLQGRRTTEQYRSRVGSFLRKGGLFVITSCNWTEDE